MHSCSHVHLLACLHACVRGSYFQENCRRGLPFATGASAVCVSQGTHKVARTTTPEDDENTMQCLCKCPAAWSCCDSQGACCVVFDLKKWIAFACALACVGVCLRSSLICPFLVLQMVQRDGEFDRSPNNELRHVGYVHGEWIPDKPRCHRGVFVRERTSAPTNNINGRMSCV